MHKRMMRYGGALFFAGVLALAGCSGEKGAPGAPGTNGTNGTNGSNGQDGQDLTRTVTLEACAGCHTDAGAMHQAVYDQYTDASDLKVTIDGVSSVLNADNATYTSTMTFTVTKAGQPVDAAGFAALDQKRFYAALYANGKFAANIQYDEKAPTYLENGQFSVKATQATFAPEGSSAAAYAYVADGVIPSEGMTIYTDVSNAGVEFGDVGTYESTANVSGCEKCHGTPYMKHGYRAAAVEGLQDFVACKACHLDNKAGTHEAWQLLVDDPAAYAAQLNEKGEIDWTTGQKEKYPYKRSVMNDTHMSHAMEFAYPQSMANCVTCHEGKLGRILDDANFKPSTCKSCHPVTGTGGTDEKRAPALKDLIAAKNVAGMHPDLYTTNSDTACTGCHKAGGPGKTFGELHSGYNKLIYADVANVLTKYADAFKADVSNASVDANNANLVKFTVTVTENVDVAGMSVNEVVPTAYVAPYGYGTKDFILAAKNQKLTATPAAGWTITAGTSTATSKSWVVTADLAVVGGTAWTDKIADGAITRVELAVLAFLPNLDGVTYIPHGATTPATAPVALNAVTKTFDLKAGKFAPAVAIVDAAKCNACHDALGTTFHTADRGGNVVACRLCHTVFNGGSHLEMQSRSIDSYVHAIHSMQPFDIGDIDFADPVAALRYQHHVESGYPNFTILNCESCHNPGTYDVPDQSASLPGILSASDTVANRAIAGVPSYVTGAASRACGSCHRAELINEDNAASLAALNDHTAAFGTLVENGDGVFDVVIAKIMGLFQ